MNGWKRWHLYGEKKKRKEEKKESFWLSNVIA